MPATGTNGDPYYNPNAAPTSTTAAVPPPMAQFGNAAPVNGMSFTGGPNGAWVQSVGPNDESLESQQLEELLRSDNPIVRQAAQTAQGYAAARGGGVSGTQAIAASNNAMYGILGQVAAANAQRIGQVGDLNEQNLNAIQQEAMGNRTSLAVANTQAGAERAATSERAREFDQSETDRLQNRQWQLADQNTQARAAMRSQVFSTVFNNIMSDPSEWSDPQGAMGMIDNYMTNIDSFFQTQFPEYFQTDQQGNPTGGGSP